MYEYNCVLLPFKLNSFSFCRQTNRLSENILLQQTNIEEEQAIQDCRSHLFLLSACLDVQYPRMYVYWQIDNVYTR